MTELKDIAYYAVMGYLAVGMTAAATYDLYCFVKNKISRMKSGKLEKKIEEK